MPQPHNTRASRPTIITLWVVFALFCARVLGQLSVVLWQPHWLPATEEWYSGLLPYQYLLPSQILIIYLMVSISLGLTRHRGFFVRARPAIALPVFLLAYLYLGLMVLRYIIRMSTMPEERWVGGCIPIFMHWGLAIFLIAFARYRRKLESVATPRNEKDPAE